MYPKHPDLITPDAFERAFAAIRPALRRYAWTLSDDPDQVRELLDTAELHCYLNRHLLDPKAHFGAWCKDKVLFAYERLLREGHPEPATDHRPRRQRTRPARVSLSRSHSMRTREPYA